VPKQPIKQEEQHTCLNCAGDAIVQFNKVWLCKSCFNKNAEQNGAIVQRILREVAKCRQSKTP